jgi:1-acyl-sn-glycerol-3-phosphate acyltransferase
MDENFDYIQPQPGFAARAFLLSFDRIVRALFRIEESGLSERVPKPCLIVANHRRDADIPILGVFLGRRRGARITGVLPHFVAREDLFEPGFLWHYWRSPWLVLARLISPAIPLARILQVFKAHPIHRIPEQSLAIVLGDFRRYLGDRGLDAVLHPRWTARLAAAGAAPEQTLSWLLRRARRFDSLVGGGWGHRRLNRAAFHVFKPVERARISAHLAVFARALAGAEAVMLAPEGSNSPDGHFQRPRAGAWRIAREAGGNLPVLPVGLAYDPSASGRRMRVFVHAGPNFAAGEHPNRRAFDAAVAGAILRATTLTGSHFAAHLVLSAEPGERVTAPALEALIGSLGAPLASAGQRIAQDAGAAAERRFAWFARAGLLQRKAGQWRRTAKPEPVPGWASRAALAAYLRNELASAASLLPDAAAAHGLRPPHWSPRQDIA